ncbi:hypothetical protein BN2475_180057 [Paraburkholderia ribeironis]|uniref:Uncharacterized protein n=2 Tax=Paraburkholderia ribeironis TaxID=1247936 RepID=A0A1N7RV28_9BURK|nr:hypothetical protein BN2475_180057 [Paraburkholderia ribeironis]
MLRVSPGALVTETGCTFGVVDCGTPVVALVVAPVAVPALGVAGLATVAGGVAAAGALTALVCEAPVGVLPPPPPQPARAAQTSNRIWSREQGFMVEGERRELLR